MSFIPVVADEVGILPERSQTNHAGLTRPRWPLMHAR
jgi:hypothetical protein